jgi:hypothetical protein
MAGTNAYAFKPNTSVDTVARASEVLKIKGCAPFFRETVLTRTVKRKNGAKPFRLSAYDARSRCLLINLGLYRHYLRKASGR